MFQSFFNRWLKNLLKSEKDTPHVHRQCTWGCYNSHLNLHKSRKCSNEKRSENSKQSFNHKWNIIKIILAPQTNAQPLIRNKVLWFHSLQTVHITQWNSPPWISTMVFIKYLFQQARKSTIHLGISQWTPNNKTHRLAHNHTGGANGPQTPNCSCTCNTTQEYKYFSSTDYS